jgi:RNA polymerase sigma-70 factor (ECF subfamily)
MTKADAKLPAESAANNIIDDEALVRRFNQGDGSAFDKIVEKYSGDIGGLANRLLHWEGNVEDVVQDIFLAVFLGLKKFNFKSTLRTWLFTITINKCRTFRYKQMLRLKIFRQQDRKIKTFPAADKNLIDYERFEQIQRIVMDLPAKYREVVVLRYLHEIPPDEVSLILGISKNLLNVRLSRARERLKKELAGLAGQ